MLEEMGVAISTLDAVAIQLGSAGLDKESLVIERAMKEIWSLSRHRYAEQLIAELELESGSIDADDKEFIKAICLASKEDAKKILEIVIRSAKDGSQEI